MIIPGILILMGNKTYGRVKNDSKNKLLYKVYPHHKFGNEPCLIPYEIKHLGFSKALTNLYITYNSQTLRLDQVIGSVDSNQAFEEYILYVYELKQSITPLRKKIIDKIKLCADPIENIVSQFILTKSSDLNIFSIDPSTSTDFDDAFSVKSYESYYVVSIYIANVPLWLLWAEIDLSEILKCSTIYLPNSINPMLPSIWSDDLCSLWADKPRLAFVLDLQIDKYSGKIISKCFSNQLICLKKNWSYTDPNLDLDPDYQIIKNIIYLLNPLINKPLDSHQVVEFWMCQMNLVVGQELASRNIGIFRQAQMNLDKLTNTNIPESIAKTIQLIQCANASYITIDSTNPVLPRHEILNVDSYLHVTSPIRRLVDIINMGLLQECLGLNPNIRGLWNIEKINSQSHTIKKVQNKCKILQAITLRYDPDEILEGWVISIEETSHMQIYVPKYNFQVKIHSDLDLELYSKHFIRIYLFENANTLDKKIKAEIISNCVNCLNCVNTSNY